MEALAVVIHGRRGDRDTCDGHDGMACIDPVTGLFFRIVVNDVAKIWRRVLVLCVWNDPKKS